MIDARSDVRVQQISLEHVLYEQLENNVLPVFDTRIGAKSSVGKYVDAKAVDYQSIFLYIRGRCLWCAKQGWMLKDVMPLQAVKPLGSHQPQTWAYNHRRTFLPVWCCSCRYSHTFSQHLINIISRFHVMFHVWLSRLSHLCFIRRHSPQTIFWNQSQHRWLEMQMSCVWHVSSFPANQSNFKHVLQQITFAVAMLVYAIKNQVPHVSLNARLI